MFKTQNLIRKTNPVNFNSVGPILLKISLLKGKNNSLFENEFELTAAEMFLKIWELEYLKIQVPAKRKIRSFTEFSCVPCVYPDLIMKLSCHE